MKYTWSEEEFLGHVQRVAAFNVGREAFVGDAGEEDDEPAPSRWAFERGGDEGERDDVERGEGGGREGSGEEPEEGRQGHEGPDQSATEVAPAVTAAPNPFADFEFARM